MAGASSSTNSSQPTSSTALRSGGSGTASAPRNWTRLWRKSAGRRRGGHGRRPSMVASSASRSAVSAWTATRPSGLKRVFLVRAVDAAAGSRASTPRRRARTFPRDRDRSSAPGFRDVADGGARRLDVAGSKRAGRWSAPKRSSALPVAGADLRRIGMADERRDGVVGGRLELPRGRDRRRPAGATGRTAPRRRAGPARGAWRCRRFRAPRAGAEREAAAGAATVIRPGSMPSARHPATIDATRTAWSRSRSTRWTWPGASSAARRFQYSGRTRPISSKPSRSSSFAQERIDGRLRAAAR